MKIVHLRSAEFFGGPERAIIGQCLHLTDHDLMCVAFSRREQSNIFLDKCEASGIMTAVIPESFPCDVRVISRLKRLLLERGVDLVVAHDYKANFYAFFSLRGTGIRLISHFRGRTETDLKDRFYNRIDWIILRRIDKIITVSGASKEILVQNGVPANAVHVVPNAIECQSRESLTPVPDSPPDSVMQIVSAGRLSFEKGFDILIDAISLIKDRAPAFKMSIYGDGPDLQKLQAAISRDGLDDIVELCGFVDDIKPVFRRSHLMVLPSRSEGMPNVILEAWSQELGVLSTAVGGVPDMITDMENGLLIPPNDPEKLSERLLWAMNHRAEIRSYGKKGYDTACARYSFGKQAELLTRIYEETLRKPSP